MAAAAFAAVLRAEQQAAPQQPAPAAVKAEDSGAAAAPAKPATKAKPAAAKAGTGGKDKGGEGGKPAAAGAKGKAAAKPIKIPRLPMVRHARKWYRCRVLKDAGDRVLMGESTEGGQLGGPCAAAAGCCRWRAGGALPRSPCRVLCAAAALRARV